MEYKFSDRVLTLKPSAIREIFKYAADPSYVSLSAGNPAPEAFPSKQLAAISAKLMEEEPILALQYSTTEGYPPLLQHLKAYMKSSRNIGTEDDGVLVTSGAQQIMDLFTKSILNEGETVICEAPSFIGSLNDFRSYKAKLVGIPMDTDGMNMEALEKALETEKNVKFIYTIPNFQNPSGITMSLEKRHRLYELAKAHDVMILEDNPYGDLRFEGEEIAPLITMDPKHLVMYSGTFSKTLAPGMRLAWMVLNDELLPKFDLVKGSTDLATPSVTQREAAMYMTNYDFDGHIRENCKLYGHRRDVMCNAIKKYFPSDVKCTYPHGGLFLWVELPEGCNARDLFKYALERKVAYVPGDSFFPQTKKKNYFRLNFSYNDDDVIEEGVKRLADALKAYLADQK